MMKTEWRGFKGNMWQSEVNLRDFIQNNYTCYDGDESFLAEPTQATNTLWGMLKELQKEERAKGGVLDMETEIVSGLTAYGAAYIGAGTKDLEKVVGLQTDKPLKRAFMPYGGIKMAEQACTTYGYQPYYSANEIDSSTQRSRIFHPTQSNLPPIAVVSLTQRSHIYRLNETYELVK